MYFAVAVSVVVKAVAAVSTVAAAAAAVAAVVVTSLTVVMVTSKLRGPLVVDVVDAAVVVADADVAVGVVAVVEKKL